MNNDAPDDTIVPPTSTLPIPPLPAPVRYAIAFGGGAIFAIALMLIFGRSAPAAAPPIPPTSSQPKTVQVVTLFNCQYLSFTDPFFILHLPKCTNHPPER